VGHEEPPYLSSWAGSGHCWNTFYANPYLRWPVILDEYVKNRDVWRCPSHKRFRGAYWIIAGPDWFTAVKNAEGNWPYLGGEFVGGPCAIAWPSGWGGVITDSLKQLKTAMDWQTQQVEQKAFVQSIGVNGISTDVKLVEVDDPVRYWICGDSGSVDNTQSYALAAYPDICCLECSGLGWTPDWEEAIACGCDPACLQLHANGDGSMIRDPELRKPYTRHLGGVNAGFLDGHAQWYNSQALVNAVAEGEVTGLEPACPTYQDVLDCGYCAPGEFWTLY